MRTIWKLLWQTAILTAIFVGCDQLTRLTGIPLPGNVLGVIVLFFLLLTGIIKEVLPGFPWVAPVRNWPGRGPDHHRRSRWLS